MRWQIAIVILIVSGLFTNSVQAASPKQSVEITYTISEEAKTLVEKKVIFTNQSSQEFIRSVSFDLGSPNITDVTVTQTNSTSGTTTQVIQEESTRLDIQVDDVVLGVGRSLELLITYQDPTITNKQGEVVEIYTPPIDKEDIQTIQNITINIPQSFPKRAYVSPNPTATSTDQLYNIYTFNQDQLTEDGTIRLTLGDQQTYQVSTQYQLSNPGVTPIETQIALLPDTGYQRVTIQKLDPSPQSVHSDFDGNWIATYRLEPRNNITVALDALVTAYANHTVPVPINNADHYLREQSDFWQTTDPAVTTIANQVTSPGDIYQYLTSTFSYGYNRIDNQSTQREGAATAIKTPQDNLCLEFTDAFVALSRANNIKARAITGYGYATDESYRPQSLVAEMLHAWPEYFDEERKIWIPVDPTWSVTTGGIDYFSYFDSNHITFAIHGRDPENPISIGMYGSLSDPKNLQVKLSEAEASRSALLDIELHMPITTRIGLTSNAQVIVTNQGNQAIYQSSMRTIDSRDSSILGSSTIPAIIPYQAVEFPIKFKVNDLSVRIPVTISINEHIQNITTARLPQLIILPILSSLLVASLGISYIKYTQ